LPVLLSFAETYETAETLDTEDAFGSFTGWAESGYDSEYLRFAYYGPQPGPDWNFIKLTDYDVSGRRNWIATLHNIATNTQKRLTCGLVFRSGTHWGGVMLDNFNRYRQVMDDYTQGNEWPFWEPRTIRGISGTYATAHPEGSMVVRFRDGFVDATVMTAGSIPTRDEFRFIFPQIDTISPGINLYPDIPDLGATCFVTFDQFNFDEEDLSGFGTHHFFGNATLGIFEEQIPDSPKYVLSYDVGTLIGTLQYMNNYASKVCMFLATNIGSEATTIAYVTFGTCMWFRKKHYPWLVVANSLHPTKFWGGGPGYRPDYIYYGTYNGQWVTEWSPPATLGQIGLRSHSTLVLEVVGSRVKLWAFSGTYTNRQKIVATMIDFEPTAIGLIGLCPDASEKVFRVHSLGVARY